MEGNEHRQHYCFICQCFVDAHVGVVGVVMTPALALFYGGMSSRRSVMNIMMMSFGSLGVIAVVYILWGWSMSYGSQSLGGVVANPFEMFGLRGEILDDAGNYVERRRICQCH